MYRRLGRFHEFSMSFFEENPERFIDACILSTPLKDVQRVKDLLELKRLLDSNVHPIFQFEHYIATH